MLPQEVGYMKKNLSLDEWKQIGTQAKKIREELFTLHNLSSGHMPNEVVSHITRAINSLDKYRCKAEDRMLSKGITEDLNIFYGSPN